MKTKLLLIAAAFLCISLHAFAQISVYSDGSDGVFVVPPNGIVDLSAAVLGDGVIVKWDTPQSVANQGKGIFDPVKWAIVFKYSSVTIPLGTTITFKNHPSHAPVVWLVSGSVNISGAVNLDGKGYVTTNILPEPGPGGFRGGIPGSAALGIGSPTGNGTTLTANATYSSSYGNTMIVPLIGGSGSSTNNVPNYPGYGGGGAILIAASNTINITGSISANGGQYNSAASSSGAIRLIANMLSGTGTLNANFNQGRIRLEANQVTGSIVPLPQTIAVTPATPYPIIWPADNAPSVKIIDVAGVAAPVVPYARLENNPDVEISVNTATVVTIETRNFTPTLPVVKVRSAGKFSATATLTTATFLSGDAALARWTVSLPFPASSFTTLQAIATVP